MFTGFVMEMEAASPVEAYSVPPDTEDTILPQNERNCYDTHILARITLAIQGTPSE